MHFLSDIAFFGSSDDVKLRFVHIVVTWFILQATLQPRLEKLSLGHFFILNGLTRIWPKMTMKQLWGRVLIVHQLWVCGAHDCCMASCVLFTEQSKQFAIFCCFRHFVVIPVTTGDRAKENRCIFRHRELGDVAKRI